MPVANQLPKYVVVGIVEKAHGLRGEVKVKPLTDDPTRFELLSSVLVELGEKDLFALQVEGVEIRQNGIFLRLSGIDSREKAEALRGAYLNIKREDVLPLGDDEFYHFEVLGLDVVTREGKHLGQVDDVFEVTSNTVLSVRSNEACREYLIPVIRDVIDKMDFDNGKIIINPIEGLLE